VLLGDKIFISNYHQRDKFLILKKVNVIYLPSTLLEMKIIQKNV